jgi:hypothetical protein
MHRSSTDKFFCLGPTTRLSRRNRGTPTPHVSLLADIENETNVKMCIPSWITEDDLACAYLPGLEEIHV